MNKDLYAKKTDEAWHRIYSRIEKDGLTEKKNHRSVATKMLRWKSFSIAACIMLCVILSAIYFTQKDSTKQLLTEYNENSHSSLIHILEDGSIVYLGEHSSIQYPSHFSSKKREIVLNGNAYFDITHKDACPFIIKTKDALIEVLGTAFDVKSKENSPFKLSVNRGLVKVTKTGFDKQEVLVNAGRTVILKAQHLCLEQTKDNDKTEPYKKSIQFKDQTLGNILQVINKQYKDTKMQTLPQFTNRKLTISFCNDSPEVIAMLISEALNLNYSVKDNVITIK